MKKNIKNILVVDDEIYIRQILVDELEDHGFKVFSASTLFETENLLKNPKHQIELVICDVNLTDGRGLDLITKPRFRPLMTNRLIIFITGDKNIDKSKVDFLLPKPFSFEQLLEVIDKVSIVKDEKIKPSEILDVNDFLSLTLQIVVKHKNSKEDLEATVSNMEENFELEVPGVGLKKDDVVSIDFRYLEKGETVYSQKVETKILNVEEFLEDKVSVISVGFDAFNKQQIDDVKKRYWDRQNEVVAFLSNTRGY